MAIALTNDKNIKKLINKLDKPKTKKRSKTLEFLEKYNFVKQLEFLPPKPPKAVGYVEKMGKFVFNFHTRYIEIEPTIGCFRRYKQQSEYPSNPL